MIPSFHKDGFLSALCSGSDQNIGCVHIQEFRKGFNKLVVCVSFLCISGKFHLDPLSPLVVPGGYGKDSGARDDFQSNEGPVVFFYDGIMQCHVSMVDKAE